VIGIDVSLPPGWSQVPSHEDEAAFAGPAEEGYRPMLVMARERFDPPTPAGLSAGIDAIRALQADEYPGFDLLAERAFEIDGRAAYLQHFRWVGDGIEVTQVLALVVMEPGWVLKVDGACLTSLEHEHLAVLDEIVMSIESSASLAAEVA
jgi:hypothetical protein